MWQHSHPAHVHACLSGLEHYVMGDAQIIKIPFKCMEGGVNPHWGI